MDTTLSTIERLEITDSLRELMAKYVRYADHKEWDELASLFTKDGSFTPLDVDGNAIITMTGAGQIRDTIAKSVGNATAIHHLFSYEVAMVSNTEATGIFAMEDYVLRDEQPMQSADETPIKPFRTLHGYGHYHASFVKVNAAWLIKSLIQTRQKLDLTF